MDEVFMPNNTELSAKAFKRLSTFINSEFGIKMPPEKKIMLQSRLLKRLRYLNLRNFDEYVELIFDKKEGKDELYMMIDLVSTHKTNFFRESQHFDYLTASALPNIIKTKKNIKVWSAGCSTGEEVYTLGMILSEFKFRNQAPTFDILGTDIAKHVLEKAAKGVFHRDTIANISLERKKRFFLKHKDSSQPFVKVVPELRKASRFQWLNLMDPEYKLVDNFDIIFCRNVLIYFERDIQEQVVRKLSNKLQPNGLLFLGHSESIINFKLPLVQIMPTIYRKA
jgi:chemotaxis protein methyltransferase CheR